MRRTVASSSSPIDSLNDGCDEKRKKMGIRTRKHSYLLLLVTISFAGVALFLIIQQSGPQHVRRKGGTETDNPNNASMHIVPRAILDLDPPSSSGLTRTVCTKKRTVFPAPTLANMFKRSTAHGLVEDWKLITDKSGHCEESLVRILFDKSEASVGRNLAKILMMHREGEQLTTSIVGGYIDKSTLFDLIQRQTESRSLLQDIIPETKIFHSEKTCHQFCETESNNLNDWLWKPIDSNAGRGIRTIGSVAACHQHCHDTTGKTQAQALKHAMLLPDGRKFDVRSHVLVANLDPLVVFAGAEKVRICAESMWEAHPMAYPGLEEEEEEATSFNPFQHVCNMHIGRKHPDWSSRGNMGHLTSGIPEDNVRERVLQKIDAINLGLVELLSDRWSGKIGMFQVFGMDYLVDESENVWLLEVNEQPGFTGVLENVTPNPWKDVLRIEWEILSILGHPTPNSNGATKREMLPSLDSALRGGAIKEANIFCLERLRKKLSSMQFDTLRMLKV